MLTHFERTVKIVDVSSVLGEIIIKNDFTNS